MSRGVRRKGPALIVAAVVAVAGLGGTVYAAGKIDGHSIKAKSLPGNRLALRSVPGNRLKPGSIRGEMLAPGSVGRDQLAPGSVTGVQIDVSTLGTVPSSGHADTADIAQSAKDSETALHAASAETAKSLNGYTAGCEAGTRLYAGACWETSPSGSAVSPVSAAASCASKGGELPDSLALAAFANEPGIALSAGDEWSSDVTNVSGANLYAVVTVSASGVINSEVATNSKKYRCVTPLLS
jgi:hypothetical protein